MVNIKKRKNKNKNNHKKRGPYNSRFDAVGQKGLQRVFICDGCKKSFNRKNNLEQHWLIHLENQEFHCEQCGKFLSKKSHLTRHIKNVHPPETSFIPINNNIFSSTIKRSKAKTTEYYTCDCVLKCKITECANAKLQIECKKHNNCENQVFRNRNDQLMLYVKTTVDKGNGLYSRVTIPPNTFIIEYVGEIINEYQKK